MRTSLKILILLTVGMAVTAGFIPTLYHWLALSRMGIQEWHLWQPITYIFLEQGPLSFHFFLQLAFNMYLLWMFGSSLIERSHTTSFLLLYLGSGVVGGLASLIFPSAVLAGSTNAIFAILVAWMILNPGSQLLLFFTLPFKAQWLILALIGMALLIDLSHAQWAYATALVASSVYGYLFTLIAWRQQSPFPFLAPLERKILRLLEKKKGEIYRPSKIYDIKSGEPVLDDNAFMDAMLDRISRHGADSLTPAEKKRMKQISERKK